MPISLITVRTSAKIDVDQAGAVDDFGDAADRAVQHFVGGLEGVEHGDIVAHTCISFSLGMMISESTWRASASMPALAARTRLPSNMKGLVTTATENAELLGDPRPPPERRGAVPPPMPR